MKKELMNYKPLTWEEWGKLLIAEPIALAQIPFFVEDIPSKTGVEFERYVEDGLGEFLGAALQFKNWCLVIKGPTNFPEAYAVVYMLGNEPDPSSLLQDICTSLNISIDELPWVSEYISGPKFSVYRVDDNGNEIEMEKFYWENYARKYAEEFDSRGHKQSYFTRELT